MSYKMKRNKKTFDFGNKGKFNFNKTMDLNPDKYGPSAGETKAMNKFNFTKDHKTKDHKKYSDLEKYDDDRG